MDRLCLGYLEARDCIVVAFRNRVGGWSYLRDASGELASVATGYLGDYRRDQITGQFIKVDEVFRRIE